jgi:type II restriction enzyme
MIERLMGDQNPNFFLLNYNPRSFEVRNFLVIPKHFFVPAIIEKRRPLSLKAKRHRWVGCNVILKSIPESGKIFYVRNGEVVPKEKVLAGWQKTLFLRGEKQLSIKGWLLDVMRCVDRLGTREFTLNEVYAFENELSRLHPENKHVRDKIRQQLQFLRDKNYLEFSGHGKYRLT